MSESAEKPKSNTVEVLEDLRAKIVLRDPSAEGAGRVAALTEDIETLRDTDEWDTSHLAAQPERMGDGMFAELADTVTAGTALPEERRVLVAEARRARVAAQRAWKAVSSVERLRSEFDRLRSTSDPAVAMPDGPHYRMAKQEVPWDGVTYALEQTLTIARSHALQARAEGGRAWLQVTHNLGRTWTDCADDGSPTEER